MILISMYRKIFKKFVENVYVEKLYMNYKLFCIKMNISFTSIFAQTFWSVLSFTHLLVFLSCPSPSLKRRAGRLTPHRVWLVNIVALVLPLPQLPAPSNLNETSYSGHWLRNGGVRWAWERENQQESLTRDFWWLWEPAGIRAQGLHVASG